MRIPMACAGLVPGLGAVTTFRARMPATLDRLDAHNVGWESPSGACRIKFNGTTGGIGGFCRVESTRLAQTQPSGVNGAGIVAPLVVPVARAARRSRRH